MTGFLRLLVVQQFNWLTSIEANRRLNFKSQSFFLVYLAVGVEEGGGGGGVEVKEIKAFTVHAWAELSNLLTLSTFPRYNAYF